MGDIVADQRLTFNSGSLELACGHMISKEQVDFAKGAILGLRQAEPAPYIAEEVGACIEESGLGAPVPSCTKRKKVSQRVFEETITVQREVKKENLQVAEIM